MKPKTFLLIAVIIVAAFVLGACATGPRVTSIPGLAASDKAAYVSYGQSVIKIDTTKAESVKDSIWRFPVKGNPNQVFHANPLVDNDKIIVGDFANVLHALNDGDGTQAWQYTGAMGWYQSAAVRDGETYYVANFDRNLYALNASDQSLKWTFKDQYGFLAAPLVVDSKVLISSQDHKLIALDKETGKQLWAAETKGSIVSAPLYIEENKSLMVGNIGNEVVWIDLESGKVLKTFNDQGAMTSIWTSPVKAGSQYAVGDDSGVVYLFNAAGDLESKVNSAGNMLAGLLPVDGGLITISSEGVMRYIKNGDNKATWTQNIQGSTNSAIETNTTPVLSGDTVVVAGLTNNRSTLMVWGYDLSGNLLWSFPPAKK